MEAAFLTNSDGYDVATLMRVIKIDVSPTHQTLNDEQWQQMINLIDAVPDLLAALEAALEAVEYYDEREGAEKTLRQVRAAIAKATGGAL